MPPKPKFPTPVLATKHKDKRANIPTEELRDFVADDEKAPKKILYPRDASLDPQLVWQGKDEQDRQPLEVPAVPIYIQEKIHPQVIIENLRAHPPVAAGVSRLKPAPGEVSRLTSAATEERREVAEQISLFSDFNGIKFEQLIEFYQHKDGVNWANRMILGDSLLVMNSLAEKEGLKGQVQMIYLDPPYGIKFGSNWQVSTRKRDVKDGKAEDATRQPEQIRAFRDTWKLGIHSYLAYLRDRLTVARELLTESGSVFVQIGDENVHLVRSIMDETFGSENFCSLVTFAKTTGQTDDLLPNVADFILWYAKNKERVKYRQLYADKEVGGAGGGEYKRIVDADGNMRTATDEELFDIAKLPRGARLCRIDNMTSPRVREARTGYYPIEVEGRTFLPQAGEWKTHKEGVERLKAAGRIHARSGSLGYVRMFDDFPAFSLNSNWTDTAIAGRPGDKIYVVQTSPKVVERCLQMSTDPGDLVLDPTCGSGTTAFVAEQWGRRWITCDTSRVAVALARTRLMAAKFPYYLLADSEDGRRKEMEVTGKFLPTPEVGRVTPCAPSSDNTSGAQETASPTSGAQRTDAPYLKPGGDIKRGFIYRRVPHVTLKAIANNEEIDSIHAEFAPKIEKALAALNKALGRVPSRGASASESRHAASGDAAYKEWEVPRDLTADSTDDTDKKTSAKSAKSAVHSEFWQLRRERQQAMDAAIARHADTELLYDQPYEDNKRLRVTGPFTVESLSPHRFLSADENGDGTVSEQEARQHHDFTTMILDNLRKAGIQNTRKEERLKFDSLEPLPEHGFTRWELTRNAARLIPVAADVSPLHLNPTREKIRADSRPLLRMKERRAAPPCASARNTAQSARTW